MTRARPPGHAGWGDAPRAWGPAQPEVPGYWMFITAATLGVPLASRANNM